MGDFTRKSAKHSLVETWFKVTIYFPIKVRSFNACNASMAFYIKHRLGYFSIHTLKKGSNLASN